MRDIKFRAKTIDKKHWVVGDLINNPENKHPQIGAYVVRGGNAVDEQESESYEFIDVIRETIGQFTGLTGKEIFEGDLCIFKSRKKYIFRIDYIAYQFCGFVLNCVNDKRIKLSNLYSTSNIEVIGNIHENDDLLNYL